jgi:RNA recognition motif-containing protein
MMNVLSKIKQIQRLNEQELKYKIGYTASWHYKYRDSAYIYIGGFPKEITEGDLVIVFSQYGEIVDCRIVRDKKTGKSKGFGYICYEDQRSTILAVDNLNGIKIGGNIILVDHIEEYRVPDEFETSDEEGNKINNINEIDDKKEKNNKKKKEYKLTGPDGKGWGEDRILSEEDILMFENMRKEEIRNENKTKKRIVDPNCILELNEEFDVEEKPLWEKRFVEIVQKEKDRLNKKYDKRPNV